jgi:hypothetical protein
MEPEETPKDAPPDTPTAQAAPERPAPDMAALMVRLAEIRREVEGPQLARRTGRAWAWILGGLIGLLLAHLLFGRGGGAP